MSSFGHGECIRILESCLKNNHIYYFYLVGIPCILVGGGGYTIENVPRCWVNETAISLGIHDLPNEIPTNAKAYDLYKPDHKLFVSVKKIFQFLEFKLIFKQRLKIQLKIKIVLMISLKSKKKLISILKTLNQLQELLFIMYSLGNF